MRAWASASVISERPLDIDANGSGRRDLPTRAARKLADLRLLIAEVAANVEHVLDEYRGFPGVAFRAHEQIRERIGSAFAPGGGRIENTDGIVIADARARVAVLAAHEALAERCRIGIVHEQ